MTDDDVVSSAKTFCAYYQRIKKIPCGIGLDYQRHSESRSGRRSEVLVTTTMTQKQGYQICDMLNAWSRGEKKHVSDTLYKYLAWFFVKRLLVKEVQGDPLWDLS